MEQSFRELFCCGTFFFLPEHNADLNHKSPTCFHRWAPLPAAILILPPPLLMAWSCSRSSPSRDSLNLKQKRLGRLRIQQSFKGLNADVPCYPRRDQTLAAVGPAAQIFPSSRGLETQRSSRMRNGEGLKRINKYMCVSWPCHR